MREASTPSYRAFKATSPVAESPTDHAAAGRGGVALSLPMTSLYSPAVLTAMSDMSHRPPPDPGQPLHALVVEADTDDRDDLRDRLPSTLSVTEAADVCDLPATDADAPDIIVAGFRSARDAVPVLAALAENPVTEHVPVLLVPLGPREPRLERDLLGQLAEIADLSGAGRSTATDAGVAARAEAIVHDQMGDATLGAADIAGAVGLSPRQLRRVLRSATGETPRALLQRCRMERAALLLRSGVSVKSAARMVGFASLSGFRAAFRRAYDVSPSRFGARG